MRRRNFIVLVGAATFGPAISWAQSPALPLVVFLGVVATRNDQIAAFLAGLADSGYVNGRNVAIKFVTANNDFSQLPALAAALMNDPPAVIVMPSGLTTSPDVIKLTRSIPIVFLTGADPVALGLVPSLNRPGGKLTGVLNLSVALVGKQLELLSEVCPGTAPLAVLADSRLTDGTAEAARKAAATLGREVLITDVTSVAGFEPAFSALAQQKVAGLAVPALPLFNEQQEKLTALAARFIMPTIYQTGDIGASGGLMSYGASSSDVMRQLAADVAKILTGTKPADLPIVQPQRFVLAINLKTAKALGLTVPSGLLASADRVIE